MDLVRWGLGAILVGGFAVSVSFSYYCTKRRETRGAFSLSILFIGITLWILADLVQLFTPSTSLPEAGVLIRFLGPDITAIGMLLFGLEYTGRERYISRQTLGLVGIKPVLTLLLVLSPFRSVLAEPEPGVRPLVGYDFVFSPVFASHTVYSWFLTGAGLFLLAQFFIQKEHAQQRQLVPILIGVTAPFAFNVVARTDLLTSDLTSTGFFITAATFTYATFRLRLFDTIPVARQRVLEEMDDMVVVLDGDDRIIMVNEAARQTFDIEADAAGAPLTVAFGEKADELLDTIGEHENGRQELVVDVDETTRHLSVTWSRIDEQTAEHIATVLVCRDVTEEKRREQELKSRQEDLRLLKDLQSRFLRHNLRNELNLIQMQAEELANEERPIENEHYHAIRSRTDRILELAHEARSIESLVERQDRITCDVGGMLEHVLTEARNSHPNVEFDVVIPEDVRIRAVPKVEIALESVLDNAARHNTSPNPRVSVRTTVGDGRVHISVADNGPGIHERELKTLRDRTETPLTHSSGLGLWLTYWVAKKSGGDLSFDVDDGTEVTLAFDQASATDSLTD